MKIDRYLVHEVSIERYAGTGSTGDVYDAPTTHPAWIDDRRERVLSATGEEVVAETQVALSLDVADVPVESLVTLPAAFGSRTSQVIAVSRLDSAGMFGLEHVKLALR